jgi:hypothetical protein
MKLPGIPYQPRYTADEIVLGVVVAGALHLLAAGPFVARAMWPGAFAPDEEEAPRVARPVIQASLLKLGKPLDPRRLPDRFVPQARTAPRKQEIASREDPQKPRKDGGAPPPPNTEDGDLANLVAKTDVFAEDAGKARPEEGHESGVDGGKETDPNRVRPGDLYAAQLGQFFTDRNHVPTIISVGEARRLCVVFELRVGRDMALWHVRQEPVKSSGNPMFDDSARAMLLKLLEDKTPLPNPPKEVDEQYRGRTVQLSVLGDPHGDPSRCK